MPPAAAPLEEAPPVPLAAAPLEEALPVPLAASLPATTPLVVSLADASMVAAPPAPFAAMLLAGVPCVPSELVDPPLPPVPSRYTTFPQPRRSTQVTEKRER
jgi:hypothetical protein